MAIIKYKIKENLKKTKSLEYPIDIVEAVKAGKVYLGERFFLNGFPATCVDITKNDEYVFSMDQIFTTARINNLESDINNALTELGNTGNVFLTLEEGKVTNLKLFSGEVLENIDFLFIPSKEQVFYHPNSTTKQFTWFNRMGTFSLLKGLYDNVNFNKNGDFFSWYLSPSVECGDIIQYVASCLGCLEKLNDLYSSQDGIGIPIFFQMTSGVLL